MYDEYEDEPLIRESLEDEEEESEEEEKKISDEEESADFL